MADCVLEFPEDFEDADWEPKGYHSDIRFVVRGVGYRLNFYDPARLASAIRYEFEHGRAYFEPNVVVVPSVNVSEMEQAAEYLAGSEYLDSLLPEQTPAGG